MSRITALALSLLLALSAAPARAEFNHLAGMVTDASGRPVPGAEVEIYDLFHGLLDVVVTDAQGGFIAKPQPAKGSLRQIRVWARGFRTFQTGWFDGAESRFRTIRLDPLYGQVRLTVLDPDGHEGRGSVYLTSPGGQQIALTGLDGGSARLTEVPAGQYTVTILAPGSAVHTEAVMVEAGRTTSVAIQLKRSGMAIGGEVRNAATGRPVAGASVSAWDERPEARVTARTDTDGRFQVTLPVVGDAAQLQVTAPGFHGFTTTIPVTGNDIDLSGTAAIKLQPLFGSIQGLVLDVNGAPLKTVRVVLSRKGYGEIAETTSTETGEFRFDRLPAGADHEYQVTALDVRTIHTASWSTLGPSGWFTLKPGTALQVVLAAEQMYTYYAGAGQVSGIVVGSDGTPVAGAKVELLSQTKVQTSTETSADGTFLLKDVTVKVGLPYTLRVSRDGYVPTQEVLVAEQSQTVLQLEPQSRAHVRVTVHPVARDLVGRVVNDEGRPVPGAMVSLRGSGREWTATSDSQGWYRLMDVRPLPVDALTLSAEVGGYQTVSGVDVTARVMYGSSLPTITVHPEQLSLTGRVLDPGGSGIAGVGLRLLGSQGDTVARATTDEQGVYRITVPKGASGLSLLVAEKNGWSASLVRGPFVTSQADDIVLFPVVVRLEGFVRDPFGQPLPGIRVELLEEGRGVVQVTTTDMSGRYWFSGPYGRRPGWLSVRGTAGSSMMPMIRIRFGTLLAPTLVLPDY